MAGDIQIRYNLRMRFRRMMVAVLLAGCFLPCATAHAGRKPAKAAHDCRLKGHKLFGKVKVVTAFPDLKVQIVGDLADLNVQVVEDFPSKCGQWKMVDAFPDLKIQFVDAFPDLKIKYVTAFPGQR
jgi:hypothetical protein